MKYGDFKYDGTRYGGVVKAALKITVSTSRLFRTVIHAGRPLGIDIDVKPGVVVEVK